MKEQIIRRTKNFFEIEDLNKTHIKILKILVYLEKTDKKITISKVSRELSVCYKHVYETLKDLKYDKMVLCIRSGRETHVSLTDKGRNLVKAIFGSQRWLK